MNPDIPQEVRIVNAIAEQLFDVWPVSIVMIDLEDRIWRMNKQMSDELQQDADHHWKARRRHARSGAGPRERPAPLPTGSA